jgi:BRCA1-associated protein
LTGATPREGGLGPSQANDPSAEKIEAIGIEYSYLLTSELDSQHSFNEEQSSELMYQINELTVLAQNFSNELKQEWTCHREEELQRHKEHEEKIDVENSDLDD